MNKNIFVLDDNFSFHTMEFSLDVDKTIFNKVYKQMTEKYGIRKQNKKKLKSKYLYYDWGNLDYSGIRVYLSKPNGYIKNDFFKYCIKIIVNPRSLINNNNEYFGIFETTYENILKVKEMLNCVLWDIGLVNKNDTDYQKEIYGDINRFRLSRIDFCVNIIFQSAEIAKHYLEILSRSDIYDFCSEKNVLKNMKNKHKEQENQLIYKYKSFNLKIYNKFEQMKEIGKEDLIPKDYTGYLRFEISIDKNKIKYINQKYDYGEDIVTFLLNASRESKKQFKKYVTFLFKEGMFMNLSKGKEYIEHCALEGVINKNQAKEMIEFLELVSAKRSIYIAKQSIDSKVTEKRIFKLFNTIKLNPISIPERWNKRGRKYNFLPSPYMIMDFENDDLFKYS